MTTLIRSTARNKLIFACHGISSEDKMINVPFEFSSIYFFCDLGFKLMEPHDVFDNKIRPDLLTTSICLNKLIPRRLNSAGDYIKVLKMDEEIDKLNYRPDEQGNILLNVMGFNISMADRRVPLHYLNFGVHFCNAAGATRKILGFDELYGMLASKAREQRQSVESTMFNYNDVFGLLRDVTARLRLDPSTTDIAMFSCRSFSESSPGQVPLFSMPMSYSISSVGNRRGGFKRDPSDVYSEMLFLDNGVAMVSQDVFRRYNIMEPYNPEFIPIADNFVKLLAEYNNERRNVKSLTAQYGEESIYRPIEVAGGSRKSKKHRGRHNKYRKHHSRTSIMKRRRTSKNKKTITKRRK